MEEKDKIADLFKDGLSDFQSPVSDKLWTNISSQLGHGAIVNTALTKSLVVKLSIGIATAIIGTIGIIYLSKDDQTPKPIKENSTPILGQENKTIGEESQIKTKKEDELYLDSSKILIEETIKKENIIEQVLIEETTENIELLEIQDVLIVQEEQKEMTEENIQNIESIDNTSQQNPNEEVSVENLDILPESSTFNITLPNIFTPNNDGANDLFELNLLGLKEISFVVMDNDGNVIFQSDQIEVKWDGRDANGDLVKQGTYIYLLSGIDESGLLYKAYSHLDIRF